MAEKDIPSKVLAIVGTALTWLPILAPILFTAARLIQARRFMFDYLMPAELFLVFLVGGGLLLWAALRMRARRRLIAWALGIAVVLLVGSQLIAVVTGLASGETERGGWQWAVVLAGIAGYTLAVAATGVGGALLLRDLYRPSRSAIAVP